MASDRGIWTLKVILLLLGLIGAGLWLHDRPAGDHPWSAEASGGTEIGMTNQKQMTAVSLPEIDRQVPETETAQFALG